MALFPAYKVEKDDKLSQESHSWLKNESCPPITLNVPISEFDKRISESETCERNSENDDASSQSSIAEKKEKPHSSKKKKKKKLKKSVKKSKKRKKDKKRYSSSSESEDDDFLKLPVFEGRNKDFILKPSQVSTPEQMLYLDTGSDKNNTIFNSTHYSQHVNYSRKTLRPLGSQKIWHPTNKNKEKRYFKSKHLYEDATVVQKLIGTKDHEEYIPISLSYQEEQNVNKSSKPYTVNSLGIFDDATVAYLQGEKNPSNDDKVLATINPERCYWQGRIKWFNEQLSKEPHNIDLWLEFVGIQDKAMIHIFEWEKEKDNHSKNRKLLTERIISLLDSAIKKNIKCIKLYLKRLHYGEMIWDTNNLKIEWEKLVNSFPNNVDVWISYLVFHQTYFPVFHINKLVQAYAKCMKRLVQMQQGTFVSHKPPENIGFILVDLTSQLASVWYQAGYMERSMALFQALIELNLFVPKHLQRNGVDDEMKLVLFEAFWDSKAPRFGEKDSVGWAKFMEKREPVVFEEEILGGQRDEEDAILSRGGSKHELWIALESSRELNHWLPWQKDPDDCEDLERMVSFSVIKQHLFFTTSDQEILYLALNFLQFLGVSISSIIIDEFPQRPNSFSALRLESLKCLKTTKDFVVNSQFDFPVIGPSVIDKDCEVYFEFVVGIIYRFAEILSAESRWKIVIILINLYKERGISLKQRGNSDISGVIKSYKEKIKLILMQEEYRTNLNIYYEYGLFESSVGRRKDAIKTHTAALQIGLQSSSSDIDEVLWRHFIAIIKLYVNDENVNQNNINKIVNMICSLVLEGKYFLSSECPNHGQILRVKRKLRQSIEDGIDALDKSSLAHLRRTGYFLLLLALLQLFTSGFKPACALFEEINCQLTQKYTDECTASNKVGSMKEILYEHYFWMIDVASKLNLNSTMTPSSIRELLKSSLSVSKTNLIFLEKIVEYQNWRDILCGFDFVKGESGAVVLGIFKVLPHIKKVVKLINSAEDGNIGSGHQLANILESFVSNSGENCPLLWRIYLRLIQVIKPNQLKQITLRAINSCPNVKCLYMDCITLVPDCINEIQKLMEEKGIRIRLPLEELDLLLEEESEMIVEEEMETEQKSAISDDENTEDISENNSPSGKSLLLL